MEVVAAVGACAAVPILYSALRPRFKTTVNCWFCNTDSKVNYADRNSFICPSCEQYNGFKTDGDYNRRIPEQTYTTPTRFCKPSSKFEKNRNRPDLIPERFGNLNMSPKNENGLCSNCNQNQEIIMKMVADFEPNDEDRWNDELEDYRYKLDRMYPLCPRCTLAVHGKIEEDKKKYSYLFGLKNNLKHAIGSTINHFINPSTRKSRSSFFAGGRLCESLRMLVLISMIGLFMADFDYLQQDAGVTFVTYPNYLQHILPFIHSHSFFIHIGVLLAHFLACYNSKCRISFSDLVLLVIHIVSLFTFAAESESEDLALIRFACSSLVSITAAISSFVPRKKLHKKRVNKIFSSAFSIASTPASQCSSQASRDVSMADHHTTIPSRKRIPSPLDRSISPPPSISPKSSRVPFGNVGLKENTNRLNIQPPSPQGSSHSLSPSSMRWRERAQSPEVETIRRRREHNKENSEAMDWDDSESVSHSVAPSITRSHFRPSIFEQAASLRGMNRESTPARELAPSVASMSLFTARDGGNGNGSVFSMRTARPLASNIGSNSQFVRQNKMLQSPARSVFAPKSFVGTPRSERAYIPEANTRTGSVFTSISQQDRDSVIGGIWQCRIVIIMFTLIFIVLVMQVTVFYMLLRK